jgi:hypothetical protein
LVVTEELRFQLESRKEVLLNIQGQVVTSSTCISIVENVSGIQLNNIVTETKISCRKVAFKEYIPTGFLPILMQLGNLSGYFDALNHLPFADGTAYTSEQKSLVLIAALASACSYNVDINHQLKPYPALAQIFQLEKIPDQCTINRYLNLTQAGDLSDLQLIFEQTQQKHGLWRLEQGPIDVDLDSTGLVVYGRTYEFANKGYISGHRGKKGYQLNLGICSNTAECLALMLDQASVPPGDRFWDILYSIAEVVGGFERIGLIRADAIHGTKDNLLMLLDRNASFLIKGRDSRTARNLAKEIPSFQWESMDILHEVAEANPLIVSTRHPPVRTVLVKTKKQKGPEYSHLYTTTSKYDKEPVEIAHQYNGRQIIEAEIKAERNGPQLNHLRTRSFYGIYSFMIHLALSMNLVLKFRHTVLEGTALQGLGLKELTTRFMNIPAKIEKSNGTLLLGFPQRHPLVKQFFKGRSQFAIF